MEFSGAVAKAARFRLSAAVALPLLLLEWLGVAGGEGLAACSCLRMLNIDSSKQSCSLCSPASANCRLLRISRFGCIGGTKKVYKC